MSDRNYGCNAKDPAGIIAVILDDAGTADEIMRELDALGFVVVPKEATTEIVEAGNWLHEDEGRNCYRAMIAVAAR